VKPTLRKGLIGLGFIVAALVAATVWLSVRVTAAMHPERTVESVGKLQRDVLGIARVGFPATDGTRLSGWVLEDGSESPWVVLGHDLGSSKGELLGLAVELQNRGFRVLLFDFRGHGESEGDRSGLGVSEKGDVLGALDYVRQRGSTEVAVFGVGMGAHAAALAASERAEVRVLVLDGLVPDASFLLEREVFGDWDFGARHLGFAARAVYGGLIRDSIERETAEAVLPQLHDRSVLLLAPATDAVLADRLEAMVGTIPVSEDHDGNLVVLPATVGGRLYGDEAERYRVRVAGFLAERMARR
jgi:pimeloyl-ACP methyl ester carboxylesterase